MKIDKLGKFIQELKKDTRIFSVFFVFLGRLNKESHQKKLLPYIIYRFPQH
jgi:hypothetical protein